MNLVQKLRSLGAAKPTDRTFESPTFWENRYAIGGDSGAGSYGPFAEYKADVINLFIQSHSIESVIEFGCGDGNQLSLLQCPQYIGLDVSSSAIRRCIDRFSDDPTKSFYLYDSLSFADRVGIFRADMAISLDVLFHLVEDDIFEAYMHHLFNAAGRYVMIYSWDVDRAPEQLAKHNLVRPFLDHVQNHFPSWSLVNQIDSPFRYDQGSQGGGLSNFYIFGREGA